MFTKVTDVNIALSGLKDNCVVAISGFNMPTTPEFLILELYKLYTEVGHPKNIFIISDALPAMPGDVNIDNLVILKEIAKTSMESKIVSVDSDILVDLAVKAILTVAEKTDSANGNHYMVADLDNVKVQKKPGGAMRESSLIEGIIVDKEITHSEMPKTIENARILLLNSGLEIEKTEFEAKISIDRPEQMKMFIEEETSMIKAMVDKIAAVKANIMFCQKGIDDVALHYLTKANISAVRRVKESDLTALAKATGARIVTTIDELSQDDLGYAQHVEEKKVELDKWVFVEKCKNPKAVSILIRGGS